MSVGVGCHSAFQLWGVVFSLGDFRISDTQCLGLSLGNKHGHKIKRDNFEGS